MSFSFTYSFNKYFLSTYFGPGSRVMVENKKNTILTSIKHRLWGKDSQPFLNIGTICEKDVTETSTDG